MDRPIEAPPLRWFLQGAERRRLAWQYWGSDLLWGLFYTSAHYVLRVMPTDVVSNLGGWFGDVTRRYIGFEIGNMRRNRVHEAPARKNWALLRPQDNTPEAAEAAMDAAFRNASSVYCEFAVLNRLWAEGRIAVEGLEHITTARAANRPVVIAGLHLGNWETIATALTGLELPYIAVYQPPANRFDHHMAVSSRRRYGVKLIPPGRGGGRIAYRALASREEMLLIYIDECIDRVVYAPFFGRPARYDGNIAYAARLAALADAAVIPAFCTRLDGAHFRVTFLPPVGLAHTADRERDLIDNVATLNAVIEPIVREHLEQWLWLFDLRADR